jgi:hypothetical protein
MSKGKTITALPISADTSASIPLSSGLFAFSSFGFSWHAKVEAPLALASLRDNR